MSSYHKCAAERHCFPMAQKIKFKEAWIAKHDLFVSRGRAYALVDTAKHVYFMDAVTGTLYQFGNCMSSEQLSVDNMTRDKEKAIDLLMASHKHELDPVDEDEA